MSKELAGKVQTVLGPVSPEDLGITLMHEHCVVNIAIWFNEPEEATQKGLAYQKVKLENLGWIRFHMNSNLDNLCLLDEQMIIEELELFKRAGGNTLVDCTIDDIGRDPSALARISRAVGINIIMGSGYYKGVFYGSKLVDRSEQGSEQELADKIIRDIKDSVRDTGVKAVIINITSPSYFYQRNL
ncbi:unnamed protein product [marine sediment metagenome]|uniref:Phosphotriesterase-related protein n=1 Tax=marine sediment metagenome TaxID=412755 RepID=X1TXT8_9ZZZZ